MSRMTCLSISFCANNLMFIAQAAEFGLSKHRWPETSERETEKIRSGSLVHLLFLIAASGFCWRRLVMKYPRQPVRQSGHLQNRAQQDQTFS